MQDLDSFPTAALTEEMSATVNTYFIHSEQAIFKALTIRKVVENIVTDRSDLIPTGKPFKVVGVILNIHSERYMCENCQCTAIYSGQIAMFKELLKELLKENDFRYKEKSNLPLTTIISAAKPFGKGKGNIQWKMKAEDHEDLAIDLRTLPDGHLFLTDLAVTGAKGLPFMIGYQDVLIGIKNKLSAAKETIEDMALKNEQLKIKNKELKAKLKRAEMEVTSETTSTHAKNKRQEEDDNTRSAKRSRTGEPNPSHALSSHSGLFGNKAKAGSSSSSSTSAAVISPLPK